MTRAQAAFDVKQWNEQPTRESGGADGAGTLVRASVVNAYRGDIDGEGRLELVMAYRDDGTASYVGLERVTGRLGGRTGGFVLQHTGEYRNGAADTTWSVVPGSGSGELGGLHGSGGYTAAEEGHVPSVSLDYELG